jgi:gluconokinase
MYMPSKILWLRHEQPDIFRRAKKYVTIKDFLIYRLTGQFIVDRSIASGGGFYNFKTMDWDEEMLSLAGVSRDQLSMVASPTHVLEGMNAAVAGDLGLSAGTRIVLGAGDGAMANLGSGVVRPGQMTATVGTSGAVRMLIPAPQTDEKGRTWCYNLDDRYWMAGAAINNGGIALRWIRDQITEELRQKADQAGRDAYEFLTDLAASAPAGSGGLLLLPLFTGERAPYWNADARAVMFGLNLAHEKRHIIRATMEGVMFRMYSIFTALEDVAGTANELRVSGSFTHSSLWLQMMADIFGRDVLVPGKPEGATFGVAAFGMVSLGILPDIESIGRLIHIKKVYCPDPDTHAIYQELFAIYQRLYWNLQNEFRDIAAFQRNWQ